MSNTALKDFVFIGELHTDILHSAGEDNANTVIEGFSLFRKLSVSTNKIVDVKFTVTAVVNTAAIKLSYLGNTVWQAASVNTDDNELRHFVNYIFGDKFNETGLSEKALVVDISKPENPQQQDMPDTDLYSELDSLLDNHDLHLCIVGVKDSKEEESVTIYARQWLDGFGIYPAFRMPPVKPDIDTEAITETVRTIFNGPASTETEEMSITTAEEHPLPVRTSVKRTHCSEEEMIRKRSRTDETKKKIVIPRRLRLRSPQSLQRQINKEVAVKIESPQRDANFLAMKSQPQQQETKDVPRKSKSTSNEQKLTEKRQPTAAGSETNRNDTYNDNKSLLKMLVKRQCKERELKDETLENLVYAGVKHSLRYAMQRQRLNEDRLSPFIMSHIDFFRNMESMGKSFF